MPRCTCARALTRTPSCKNSGQKTPVPLCDLTGGIHLHLLRCPDLTVQARVLQALSEKGVPASAGVILADWMCPNSGIQASPIAIDRIACTIQQSAQRALFPYLGISNGYWTTEKPAQQTLAAPAPPSLLFFPFSQKLFLQGIDVGQDYLDRVVHAQAACVDAQVIVVALAPIPCLYSSYNRSSAAYPFSPAPRAGTCRTAHSRHGSGCAAGGASIEPVMKKSKRLSYSRTDMVRATANQHGRAAVCNLTDDVGLCQEELVVSATCR